MTSFHSIFKQLEKQNLDLKSKMGRCVFVIICFGINQTLHSTCTFM